MFAIEGAAAGDGGTETIRNQGTETQIGTNISLDDLPGWLPVYPNANDVTSASRQVVNGKTRGTVTFDTNDSPASIAEHYKSEFEDQGYTITDQTSSSVAGREHRMMKATHPDGKTVTIIAGAGGAKQALILTYEE